MAKVIANFEPPLFVIKNLLGQIQPGYYYKEQLTVAPKPKANDYFFVERVLHKKKIKGKLFYLCKFLYYPSAFNAYVSEEDLISRTVKP